MREAGRGGSPPTKSKTRVKKDKYTETLAKSLDHFPRLAYGVKLFLFRDDFVVVGTFAHTNIEMNALEPRNGCW